MTDFPSLLPNGVLDCIGILMFIYIPNDFLNYRVSQKKCPIILKLSCLKYEHLIMGFMICLGRVILPAFFGTLFIWIFACMTE